MRKIVILILAAVCACRLSARQTYAFVERDSTLYLDVYTPAAGNGYTVVHIFGGGFVNGSRQTKWDADYCRRLAEEGYTAIAIDYRLGLRGVKDVGLTNLSALENAFYIAAEDCAAAVKWIVDHATELGIDPQKIILEGSSAGAITALMTDYARCNGLPCAAALPTGWRPAGVVAYSGAVYSRDGKVKWTLTHPAPTLLFHGTADRIVTYKQIEFFSKGLYGADALAKRFEKYNLPYCIYRYTGLGHEISVGGPMTTDELNLFVEQYVSEARPMHTDITTRNDSIRPSAFSKMTVRDLYSPKRRKDL